MGAAGCRQNIDGRGGADGSDSLDVESLPPQPAEDRWGFTEDLKAPLWTRHAWSKTRPAANHADLSGGVRLEMKFPDPQGRLTTAYEDLREFLAAGAVSSDNGYYTIETGVASDLPAESFRLEVGAEIGRLLAADTEGIRRGVFYLEDEMLRLRGPYLPLGVTQRTPLIQRRISRCFFGPIKRPPKMRDELMDDVDYYPEQYLNRLAHEGVNGLWLTIEFRDLAATLFTPDAGQDAERRLAKLRQTVAKCLRYGIRTYIFCIEPRAWEADSPVPQRHPELAGSATSDGKHYFCPSTKAAQQYLYQSVNSIFRAVPELGGLINISHGERATTCLSALSAVGDGRIDCPRCSHQAPWAILHDSLSAMERGMHDAAPGAELVSWLYMPQARGSTHTDLADWVYEIPAHTPKGVILQFNFESGVRRTVFGKELVGGDYWISTPGPSSRFERIAEVARQNQTSVSAKIQTGSSHEVATVPYVPVPSLLYRKFAAMRRLGVSHTMLCWYFGNYPGLMNKAAGELSFEPFPKDEDAFLRRLASIQWGQDDAPAVVKAWKHFSDGYENYPLTNLFQYYGPMHDGPVWPLLLKPRDAPLAPTWLLGSTLTRKPWPPSGDRIGESILEEFTLEEATELTRRMSGSWDRGVEILRGLAPRFNDQPERLLDIGVAEALRIQFRTGHNILRFYQQREAMLRMDGLERLQVLSQLSDIAREELDLNEALLSLCERDSRLGFHSEAEGYKYFPEKIRWRMEQLRNLLAVETPALERKIREDQPLFPEYTGKQPTGPVASCVPSDGSIWSSSELIPPSGLKWQSCSEGSGESEVRWGASYDVNALYLIVTGQVSADRPASEPPVASVLFKLEPRRLWPCKHFIFVPGGEPRAQLPDKVVPQSVEGRIVTEGDIWRVVMRIPFERTGLNAKRLDPVRMDLRVQPATGGVRAWRPHNPLTPRLALGSDNPADLGWLLFEPQLKP
jgi:hypothetical protein